MTDRKTIPGKFVWFEHVSSDPKRAQAFYAELFGWRVQAFPEGGTYEMIVAPDGSMLGGYARATNERARWLSFASVHDVDRTVAAAVAAGGTIVVPPGDMSGVGRIARIADPQGAELWVSHNDGGDPPDLELAPYGTFFWNELHTTAATEAVAFYTKVLGYTAVPMVTPSHSYHVLEGEGEGRGGISDHIGDGMAPHWLPYVHVDDADATLERARKHGAMTPVTAMDIPTIGRFGVLKDPSGAILAVMKPLPRQG
jgi:predicted enzyme related to lactoylglutathione lyase